MPAGQPATAEHVDGKLVDSEFPALINPVQPFLNLRSLTHEVVAGLKATVRMEGDTFETEDCRNWTDASFKTYVRPLARPWPYTRKAGEPVTQSIKVSLSGKVKIGGSAKAENVIDVKLDKPLRMLDFVMNTTCPIVHAADDRSVVETLEALPYQIKTARTFLGKTPHRVGPSAIGCRDHPHGATFTPNPDNERICLAKADPRSRALFGAAWLLGYIATFAHTGIE